MKRGSVCTIALHRVILLQSVIKSIFAWFRKAQNNIEQLYLCDNSLSGYNYMAADTGHDKKVFLWIGEIVLSGIILQN